MDFEIMISSYSQKGVNTHTHTHIYIYIYMVDSRLIFITHTHIYMRVCVSVYASM